MKACMLAWFLVILVVFSGCATPAPKERTVPPYGHRQSLRSAPRRPVQRPMPAKPPAPIPLAGRRRAPEPTIGPRQIMVDAGHGGKDPGALGVGPMVEEEVNLHVATRLARQLRKRKAKVTMTRTTDRFLPLDLRADLADRQRVDLFVSIHADACSRPHVSGTTVYVARAALSSSRAAAAEIVAAFKRAGIPCRGVREANFRVLAGHSRPAVLIECGYLTNHQEARRLATSSYQQKLAEAITDGLTRHFQSSALASR